MKYILLILLVLLCSCSFKKNLLENQVQKGHEKLYSEPDPIEKPFPSYKQIVIAATNDIRGNYSAHELPFSDKDSGKGTIGVGGVDVISNYFKILRQQYENVIILDSGDIFSDNTKDVPIISNFYSHLKYDAFTIGLKDLSIKLQKNHASNAIFLKDFSSKSKTPLILSNLYDLKTSRIVEWEGALPYLLKEVGDTKIGIIGLVPDDVALLSPVDNRIGLYVESMLQSTLRHARLLRSLGAEIVVVMTHQGLDCGKETSQNLKLPLMKVNFEPKAKNICNLQSALGDYLLRLPPHLVDLVIAGRNHQKISNYVNETLVLSSFGEGKSFSYAEFFIDNKTKKIDKEKTIAHQPVMFCREFFKESNDCYSEDSSINHKEKIPASFLGEEIKLDLETAKLFFNKKN